MVVIYPPSNIPIRTDIIKTQLLFLNFLTQDSINILIHLFDENCLCKNRHHIRNRKQVHPTITRMLQEARKKLKIKSDATISSYANKYMHKPGSSTLGLHITKNGKEFIHLTIHLAPKKMDPTKEGVLHFVKDVYTVRHSSRNYDIHCALINVEQINKDTLHFSIGYGYNTPLSSISTQEIDEELQMEMDAILHVLNRIFNASDPYYINNTINYPLIEANKTHNILLNMNQHINVTTRKNHGSYMSSQLVQPSDFNNIDISNNVISRSQKANRRRTRKQRTRHKYMNYNNFD
jgi:hypothetical protein